MNQSSLIPHTPINGASIRKEWYKGEWYYSIIDIIAEMLETDYKRAPNLLVYPQAAP